MVRSKRPSHQQSQQRSEIVKGSVQKFRVAWQHIPHHLGAVRFVGGDYGDKASIREEAQAWFLDALLCVPSSPSGWLRDHVWPRYLAALGPATQPSDVKAESELRARFERELRAVELGRSVSLTSAKPSKDSQQDLREAAESLVQWSHRFHLRGQIRSDLDAGQDSEQGWRLSAWPLLAAEETLWTWYTSPSREEMLRKDPPDWQRPVERVAGGLKPPEFLEPIHLTSKVLPSTSKGLPTYFLGAVSWYVTREPEKLFRERIREAFERWLDSYVATRQEQAKANGLVRAPEKRDIHHFVWLALYQVEAFSASAIADACSVNVDTVKDTIERIAELVGLELRPGRRGRRRKMGGFA